MPVQAIVYSSNTGFTAQYAAMLGRKTELPVYTLAEAAQKLQKGARVVYMSWLMAGTLVDYKKASKLFDVAAVCSVGLNATQAQADKTRKSSGVPVHVPLFPLQGGYDESNFFEHVIDLVTNSLIISYEIKQKFNQYVFEYDSVSRTNYEWWTTEIRKLIDYAKERDLIRDVDSEVMSYAIWCYCRGYNADAVGRDLPREEAIRNFRYSFGILLDGLKKQPT